MADETVEMPDLTEGFSATLYSEVKQQVQDRSLSTIRDAVVEQLVNDKLAERRALVVKALLEIKSARGEISKLRKKGTVVYGADGKPRGEPTFTKADVDEIAKASKKIAGLESALEKALTLADYDKLTELVK